MEIFRGTSQLIFILLVLWIYYGVPVSIKILKSWCFECSTMALVLTDRSLGLAHIDLLTCDRRTLSNSHFFNFGKSTLD